MAAPAKPVDARDIEVLHRPNIASADVQLPAVRDYEQVDNEIAATLSPTAAWYIGLFTAVGFLLLGIAAW
ncbi:MAG TPA: hydrogenase, partial [Gemmatimonadaceae bacterium]|nr:hydrogenase [Gemmatimonadaceae bacterium]